MNPFNLRGPEFLLFYGALGLVGFGLLVWLRRTLEPAPPSLRWNREPHAVAHLRGGRSEVLRIAVLSLIGRGKLRRSGTWSLVSAPEVGSSDDPLERALLAHFRSDRTYATIGSERHLLALADAPRVGLERQGFLYGDEAWRTLRRFRVVVVVVLLSVGIAKLAVAVSRDRPNVGWLLTLLFVYATLGTVSLLRSRRTSHGAAALEDLRTLFGPRGPLRRVSTARAADPEVLLTAAVVGVAAPPFERPPKKDGDPYAVGATCGGVGCGGGAGPLASSGDGGGASCGSGCGGGGGCGGGCGGCGS